jgi:hypothetical protein
MNKKWMPITAGILDILNGIFGIITGYVLFIIEGWLGWGPLYKIGGPVMFFIGVLAIVGGIFTFKRKRWCPALAGSIIAIAPAALLTYFQWSTFDPKYFFDWSAFSYFVAIPAIAAIVLTVLSRKQFE